jgi:hypothetical protein
VKVRGHYTEVSEGEVKFSFCGLQGYEHDFSPQLVPEYPDFVICPGYYMIKRTFCKFMFFVHDVSPYCIYVRNWRFALVF